MMLFYCKYKNTGMVEKDLKDHYPFLKSDEFLLFHFPYYPVTLIIYHPLDIIHFI